MKLSLKYFIPFVAIGILMLPYTADAQAHRGAAKPAARSEGVHKESEGVRKEEPRRTPNTNSSVRQTTTTPRSTTPASRSTQPTSRNATVNNNHNNTEIKGNKVDNSRNNNVNINVDNSKTVKVNNSHNTNVRANNNIHYGNPHYYGGHNYYCSRPYYYHPYRPYRWGPVWHPWGFFAATLATTAIIVSIENQPQPYYYDQGVYYMPGNGGYTVVQAPVGASIVVLPTGYETVQVSPGVSNFYYGGAYYEKSPTGYVVVQPTAGTIVANLPDGGTEVTMGSVKYVQFGSTYYQPVQVNGQSMYEVVLMK